MTKKQENGVKGRRTKWKDSFVDEVFKFAQKGLIETEIASELGISIATLNIWKHDKPEFLDSLLRGKSKPDQKVANSLFKRANGFEKEDVKIVYDEAGNVKERTVTKTFVAGDVKAQEYWLKNRNSKEWNATQNIDLTTRGQVIIDPDEIKKREQEQEAEQEAIGGIVDET
jgi:hypothetical protein